MDLSKQSCIGSLHRRRNPKTLPKTFTSCHLSTFAPWYIFVRTRFNSYRYLHRRKSIRTTKICFQLDSAMFQMSCMKGRLNPELDLSSSMEIHRAKTLKIFALLVKSKLQIIQTQNKIKRKIKVFFPSAKWNIDREVTLQTIVLKRP